MIRLEPDKVRFLDSDAERNEYLVHTVDFSDERSTRHFVTVWTKGKIPEWPDSHHDRDTYHRDPPWIPDTYPGKQNEGWSTHYHVDLERPPTIGDLAPFAAHVPPAIIEQITAWA